MQDRVHVVDGAPIEPPGDVVALAGRKGAPEQRCEGVLGDVRSFGDLGSQPPRRLVEAGSIGPERLGALEDCR